MISSPLLRIFKFLAIFLSFFLACNQLSAEKKIKSNKTSEQERFRVMFYNVENLFDTINDPFKKDDEYTPFGDKHWTGNKYRKKLINIYKVIMATGRWEPPEIIGLCEVENEYVLKGLTQFTPLAKFNYKYVHKDSPDIRGIDVALLYQPEKFSLIKSSFIKINFSLPQKRLTRDILYAKGIVHNRDTIHLFVNHWPSRMGGVLETEPSRMFVARVLKNRIDSIMAKDSSAKILIMGDFNDEPNDKSLSETLHALKVNDEINKEQLYNMSFNNTYRNQGTCKYKSRWFLFDQFVVSGGLLNINNGVYLSQDSFIIFNNDFLLEEDAPGTGYKPIRTYVGYRYRGGFSDHLPIFVDIILK